MLDGLRAQWFRPSAPARAHAPRAPIDMIFFWCVVLLLAIGLVMVYSASIAMSEAEKSSANRASFYMTRHAVYMVVSVVAAWLVFQLPMALWQRASPFLFMAGGLLLVLVLIPGIGREVNGSRRWIPLGIMTMQPSELMKLLTVIYAADYTVRKAAFMDDFKKGFLPMFAVMVFMAAMLLRQPDFGALVVITDNGDGTWAISGLLFHMEGDWQVIVGLAGDGGLENAVFDVACCE